MKYKKIYIEITNVCNLNCSFCAKTNREPKFMSLEEFKIILNKIKDYTNYIYLHVLGEPLLHPKINEFISIANELGFNVNITSNGYLINNINDDVKIRQINISLHSYIENNNLSLDDYLNNIFLKASKLVEKGTYINYRLWVNNKNSNIILNKLNQQYHSNITINDRTKTLASNIFYSKEKEFTWPSKIEEGRLSPTGTCRALKDHIAILVDGTIVPCCLDNNANINLGNIFNDNLDEIINSSTYKDMLKGFNNNQKINKLCQKCNFYSLK
jgi:radical SAM protein with 4Fe4S-binding SPASM domain